MLLLLLMNKEVTFELFSLFMRRQRQKHTQKKITRNKEIFRFFQPLKRLRNGGPLCFEPFEKFVFFHFTFAVGQKRHHFA